MFEDALVESTGRIRTRSGWFSGVAALFNGGVVSLLLLWPLLHPASLPRQALSMLLVAPAPPAAPAPRVPQPVTVMRQLAAVNPFTAPRVIPTRIADAKDVPPPVTNTVLGALDQASGSGSATSVLGSFGTAAAPDVHVAPPKKLAISSGVMAGNKLSGETPQYPAIARAARQQGTVVLAATIARTGAIENLHVVEGPPLLTEAALQAVRTWRYRPYMLNGEPVEVETTVRVIFSLGN